MDLVNTPKTEVANATGEARKGTVRRPKKLVKGSAAAKRWMAHVRSHRRVTKRKKSPARKRTRKHHKSPGRPRRVGRPRKTHTKTPRRKTHRKKSSKKSSKKGRK